MAVFGIVSEFNPFHSGHKYLIDSARTMGAKSIVCAMSGNTTQRGELALIDKYARAEAACDAGADLVVELPFPFSCASAESFALGGIYILSQFCDSVIFGSECGDIEALKNAAKISSTSEFKNEYSKQLENGERSAKAYVALVREATGLELLSNDLLGVEYIKAADFLGISDKLSFYTIKRKGSAYRESELSETQTFDSAMAIREAFINGKLSAVTEKLPKRSFEVLSNAFSSFNYTYDEAYFDAARFFFRLCDPEVISEFSECDGGIAQRICKCAHTSCSGKEFFESLRTKRYTDAKLRRAILFALCSVKDSDLLPSALPKYTLLLAANEQGRKLLSAQRKKEEKLTVITKPADASQLTVNGAKRQLFLSDRSDAIYSFSLMRSSASGESTLKKPYIS